MAYSENDILVIVRGMIGPAESWSNTWAFAPTAGDPNRQACVDALREMYNVIAADWFPTEFTAVGAQIHDLFANVTEEADWTLVTGTELDDMLPSQLAIRVSLNDNAGVNGGPFIAGWNKASAAEDGLFDSGPQTALLNAVQAVAAEAILNDYNLALHRPTVPAVNPATRVRIGERFDVIRKRGNDTAETYATAALLP